MPKICENNYAFIDSQNLYLGIKNLGWALDFKKFRIYIQEKYNVTTAYFFVGYIEQNKNLYSFLKKAGYILVFKPVLPDKEGSVKGNIDADLVLQAMIEYNNYNKAVIVTSDGDFYSLVKYLDVNNKLKLVISPYVKTCSVLLKKAARGRIAFMNILRQKLEYIAKKHRSRTEP